MDPSLTPAQIEQAASMLTRARLSLSTLPSLEPGVPLDPNAAHLIANAHAEMLGWDVIGWKVGAASALAMQILGVSEPFAGRVFEGTAYGSKILQFEAMNEPLVESEFAFILGEPLPPREQLYSLEEVKAATEAVAPAFEIVSSRLDAGLHAGLHNAIADSGANGGVVLGTPVPTKDCPPLTNVSVVLSVGGEQVATGVGSDILDDPWRSLEWLANHLSARQIGLVAGQFVMSGTCTGVHPLPGDTSATATFDGFGEVTINRTASS